MQMTRRSKIVALGLGVAAILWFAQAGLSQQHGPTAPSGTPSPLPYPMTPCNMNCSDTGNVVAVTSGFLLDNGKHRLFVLTDVGADNDDNQSLVRLVLYSNDIDIEGLVATTSTFMMDRTNPQIIRDVIDAYSEVRSNLVQHDSHYPTGAYLQSLIKVGVPVYGMAGVGPGKDSEGSNLLISALKKPDPRPLWVSIWGGPNVLAQALWKIRSTESAIEAQRLIGKLRVYAILDQDDSGMWIRKEFPDLFYICSGCATRPFTGGRGFNMPPDPTADMVSKEWIAKNVQEGHGPLGEVYPDTAYGNEGDTPSYLSLIPNGLNDPEHPDFGGWGGRFQYIIPDFVPPTPVPPSVRSQNVVLHTSPETRPFWTNAEDSYPTPMAPRGRGSFGLVAQTTDNTLPAKSFLFTTSRWREDVQNDFAARMEWTTKPFSQANHPPIPVLGANTPEEFYVHSGKEFHLNATGSHDPDGDSLSYYWFEYVEAGDVPEPINIRPFAQNLADLPVVAPAVTSPKTVHFILRVTDKGTPPLSRYKRVIVHILP